MNENRIKNKQCYVGHCGHPTLSSIECVIYTLILHPGPKLHMHYNLKQISNPGKTYEEVSNGQSPLCCIIYLHFLTGVAIWTGVTRSDSHVSAFRVSHPLWTPLPWADLVRRIFSIRKRKVFFDDGDNAKWRCSNSVILSRFPPPLVFFLFVCFFLFVIFCFLFCFSNYFSPPLHFTSTH